MFLNEIILKTNDLAPLRHFYASVLGLQVTEKIENAISIVAGSSTLVFEKYKGEGNPFYHFAFNIPAGRFEEAYAEIKSKTNILWLADYNSDIADFVNWNAKSFYFFDPAGNIVECITRFDLPVLGTNNISDSFITNISEIGLVFPEGNFEENTKLFMKKYGLQLFSKQLPGKHFIVSGDHHGLFIMVAEKRIWYGTNNKMAGIFPLRIKFVVDDTYFAIKM